MKKISIAAINGEKDIVPKNNAIERTSNKRTNGSGYGLAISNRYRTV